MKNETNAKIVEFLYVNSNKMKPIPLHRQAISIRL